jgi:hypothetical protein
MKIKSILELKNMFSTKEQLTITQQVSLKGGLFTDKRNDAKIPPTTIKLFN